MFRRRLTRRALHPPRDRIRSGRRASQELILANQMIESGNYAVAAEQFENIARIAEMGGGRHLPQIYLQAGRARILAGDTEAGLSHLKRGLSLFAKRGEWLHLHRAGNRVVAELNQQGLTVERSVPMKLTGWMRLPPNAPTVAVQYEKRNEPVEMIPPNLTENYIREKLKTAWDENDGIEMLSENRKDGQEPTCAAVLIPLVWFGDEWHLLYTRRTDRVETHKGQVSFPGGACDPGEETPEQTALREAEEEVGIHPQDVRVLGKLTPMITITSFRVTPVVGVVKWPYAFRVENAEVARVFTIPLAWLANKNNRWKFKIPGRPYSLIVYHPYDGETLWGATAIMTDRLMQVLGL